MPNKKVDDVKNPALRQAGQDWQRSLGVKNLTTREQDQAADMASRGTPKRQIRDHIEESRNH
ncbi:MAG: hypothetical protein ACYC5Y_10810 [Symbiobacteriia bacterium]